MKLNPSTLFLILIALGLAGVVSIVQTQPPPDQKAQEAAAPQNLFAFQEKQVQAFTLQTPLRSLKFARNPEGKWQMLEPEQTAASDSSIAFLLNLVATGKSDRSFTAPVGDREQYSLHQPLATLEMTLDNQETHKLVLGGYDFNRGHIYALADPAADPKADLTVLLVSPDFEKAVSRPLEEWKQATGSKTLPSTIPSVSPSAESPAPASPDVDPGAASPSP